jgi:hypothetical protein
MTEKVGGPTKFSIVDAPLGVRVNHGLRRGALIGGYLGAAVGLAGIVMRTNLLRLPDLPRAIMVFVVGGALAGATLLAGQPRVRNTWEAILLAAACHGWLVMAFVVAVQGLGRWTAAGTLGGAAGTLLLGIISGAIMWRGWYKHDVD